MKPKPLPNDWHGVAESRLTAVLGPAKGTAALADALQAIGVTRLESASDLHRLAQHLSATGGFASAVGGLLSVHATLYGAGLNAGVSVGSDPPA